MYIRIYKLLICHVKSLYFVIANCTIILLQVDAYLNNNKARFASHMARKLSMVGLIIGIVYFTVCLLCTVAIIVDVVVGAEDDSYDY